MQNFVGFYNLKLWSIYLSINLIFLKSTISLLGSKCKAKGVHDMMIPSLTRKKEASISQSRNNYFHLYWKTLVSMYIVSPFRKTLNEKHHKVFCIMWCGYIITFKVWVGHLTQQFILKFLLHCLLLSYFIYCNAKFFAFRLYRGNLRWYHI